MKFVIELVIVTIIARVSSAIPVLINADCGCNKPIASFLVEQPQRSLLEPARPFIYELARQAFVDAPTQQHLVVERPVQQVLVERPYLQNIIVERPIAQQIVVERPTAQQVMVERPYQQQIVVQYPYAQQAVVERQPIILERQCSQPIIQERQFAQPVISERPCSQSAVTEEARPVYLHVQPIVQTLPVPEITMYENSTNNPMSSSNSYTVFNYAVPAALPVNEVVIAEPEQIVESLTVERSPQVVYQPPAPTCVQRAPVPVVLQAAPTSYMPSIQSPPAICNSDAILQTPTVVYHPELVQYQPRIPYNSGVHVY